MSIILLKSVSSSSEAVCLAVGINMELMLRMHNNHFYNAAMQHVHTRRRVKLAESFA